MVGRMRDSRTAEAKRNFHVAVLIAFPDCELEVGRSTHADWLEFASARLHQLADEREIEPAGVAGAKSTRNLGTAPGAAGGDTTDLG